MGPRLDDNAREALQFLALGVGMVLLFRLVLSLAGRSGPLPDGADGLAGAIGAFRNGYLWQPPGTLVTGGIAIEGRLSLAAMLALAGGALSATIAGAVARLLGRNALRAAVGAARAALLLAAAWGTCAALFLPPRSVHIGREAIVLMERPALFGEVSWPWPARETVIPWSQVVSVEARSLPSAGHAPNRVEEVVIRTGEGERSIARTRVPVNGDAEAPHDGRGSAARLVASLERLRAAAAAPAR